MGIVARLIVASVAAVALSLGAILAGALLSPSCTALADRGFRFDTAVVLGGGMDHDGRLHRSSADRVSAGMSLLHANAVDHLHMTGGPATANGPAAGAQMAALAISIGADDHQVTAEEQSHSTLQNALFSRPQLSDAASLVLVSEGFHLTRAWLSFAWAGLPADAICHSTRFRIGAPGELVRRELAAFWFNLGRATVWSGLALVGADDQSRTWMLN